MSEHCCPIGPPGAMGPPGEPYTAAGIRFWVDNLRRMAKATGGLEVGRERGMYTAALYSIAMGAEDPVAIAEEALKAEFIHRKWDGK